MIDVSSSVPVRMVCLKIPSSRKVGNGTRHKGESLMHFYVPARCQKNSAA